MKIHFERCIRKVLGIGIVLLALSACGTLCKWNDEAENASADPAYYSGNKRLPFNAWVRNEKLELALHETLEKGGIQLVVSKYLFQCSPQPSDCADCYVCTRTVQKTYDYFTFGNLATSCQAEGEMMLRAEIGPGSTVSATSFWKK